MHITGSRDMGNPDHEYLIILNWWGLTILSRNFVDNFLSESCACDALVVLIATENILINQSKLTSRNAAEEALSYMIGCSNFTCQNHKG